MPKVHPRWMKEPSLQLFDTNRGQNIPLEATDPSI